MADLEIGTSQAIALELQRDCEAKRLAVSEQMLNRLRGHLTDTDRSHLDGAFRALQNEFLRMPLRAISDHAAEAAPYTLADALGKLFGLLPTTAHRAE